MLAEIFGPDLIVILVIVAVVLFGGAAIPKLARNLGSAKGEFEKGLKTPAADDTAGTSNASDSSPSSNGAGNTTAKAADDKPATPS